MKNDMTVSLIIPCYNEEANIQKGVLDKIGNYTKHNDQFVEVIIIDDGSSDGSKNIINNKYLKVFPKFKLIENSHQGKAYAIMTGIQKATGEFVLFSDMDLATPIEESEKLIREVNNGYDIVIGSRNSRRDGAPFTRKILSFGAIFIRSYLVGLRGIKDTQCGFKLFKRDTAEEIDKRLIVFGHKHSAEGSSVSAGYDMEFLFLARKMGHKIKEVPVMWRHVETKRVSFFKDAKEALTDIISIRWNQFNHKYDISPFKKI